MSVETFISLFDLVSSFSELPGLGPVSVDDTLLEHIGTTDFGEEHDDDAVTLKITLAVDQEFGFDLPGFGGLQVVIGSGNDFFELPIEIDLDMSGPVPAFVELRVTGQLALRAPTSMLKPMVKQTNGKWVEASDENCEFALNGTVTLSANGNISFGGSPTFALGPAMVGESGVIVEAEDVKLVFSDDSALPPGAPSGFRGLFIGTAELSMKDDGFPISGLSLDNAMIGRGGFSGEVNVNPTNLTGTLAGFDFTLTHFELTFKQNAVTSSDIRGELKVPFFDRLVGVALSLSADGSFAVGLSPMTAPLSIAGLLQMDLDSLEFASRAGVAELSLGGSLQMQLPDNLKLPKLPVTKLTITSTGDVIVDGGWMDLGDALSFDYHGFQMALTRVRFDSEGTGQAKRNSIGLSASIKLVDGLAIGGSVDGLKVSWNPAPVSLSDLDVQITIDGIAVDLSIPDVLEFKGRVHSLKDPAVGFAGDVHLALPKLNFAGEASILVGKQGSTTFFYLAVSVDLPLGMPLAQSGIAFYGFQGLIGFSVYPNRTAGEAWYEDWYAKPTPGVTSATKWMPPVKDAFAIGLGATLGTFPDNGFSVSGRVLVALVFPGPLLLIEGRANFLAPRTDLTSLDLTKPPFRALLVLDKPGGTVLLNLSAMYEKQPLIKLAALAEAFFSLNDPGAWHLYLGVDEPRDRRIAANVFGFLEVRAYWMLTAADLRFGAWAGYAGNWSFGPLSVALQAWAEGGARVGFDPVQIAGFLDLHGTVSLHAFGIGLGLSVDARLEAEAPKPFRVKGNFDVEIGLPWPLPDLGATVTLAWEGTQDAPDFPSVIKSISIEHGLTGGNWKGAGGTIPDTERVPMDGRPVISFARAVQDNVGFTGGAATMPYAPEHAGRYTFTHELTGLTITDITDGQSVPVSGTWKVVVDGDKAVASKLEIRGKNPFEYYGSSSTGYAQWVVDHLADFPCGGDVSGAICQALDTLLVDELLTEPVAAGALTLHPVGSATVKGAQLPGTPVVRIVGFGGAGGDPQQVDALKVTFPEAVESVEVLTRVVGNIHGSAFCDGSLVGKGILAGPPSHSGLRTMSFGEGVTVDELVFGGYVAEGAGEAQAGFVVDLAQICWRLSGSAQTAALQSMLQGVTADSITQWYSEEAIFKANHNYKVEVTTKSTRSGPGGISTNIQSDSLTFTTGAPPALEPSVHWAGEPAAGNPYDSLRPYVFETVPADGQRPVYRSYDVGVAFNREYVESMYSGDLRIRLFALGDREVATGIGLASAWGRGRDHSLTESEVIWLGQLSSMGCQVVDVDSSPVIHNTTLTTQDSTLLLEPELRHEARLFAAGVEAHRFSFVTSRYRDFKEHLGSFDSHVWVDETAAPDASQMKALVLQAQIGVTLTAEAPLFEQLYYDILGLPQRALPQAVEWSEVRTPDGAVALLLSSPEPIDWRRVTAQVSRFQPPGWAAQDTTWIRHADGSRALVFFPSATESAGSVPNGIYRVQYTFARDMAGVPRLSVAGDSSSESTTHTFSLPAAAP